MLASKKTKRGVIGAVVLAGVLATSGFAFTNSLSVDDAENNAGYGQGEIADVTVADATIHYTPTTGDPTTADAVTFDITTTDVINPATQAFVRVVSTGTWTDPGECTITTLTVTCDLTGAAGLPQFADIDTFDVVVAD